MATMRRGGRIKRLGPRSLLQVLREDQVDPSDYEAITSETQIATGVEQVEEKVGAPQAPGGWVSALTCHIGVPSPGGPSGPRR